MPLKATSSGQQTPTNLNHDGVFFSQLKTLIFADLNQKLKLSIYGVCAKLSNTRYIQILKRTALVRVID